MITAAINKEPIHINGKCYDTPDGTCIRDFVHVWDIAMAHALAAEDSRSQSNVFNLGSGHGISILEILQNLEDLLGYHLLVEWDPPRKGDPPKLFADPNKALKNLKWCPSHSSIEQILVTTLKWFNNR